MIRPVTKCVKVSVTPTINELADIIWGMDCEEQALLLQILARQFNTPQGYTQMSYIADEVARKHLLVTIGTFIDRVYEYLGWGTLKEIKKNSLIEERGKND